MHPTDQSDPQAYAGLHLRPDETFPRTCSSCQKHFANLDDFVANTSPIFRSSGLLERDDPVSGATVLLMRNCTCGTSLAVSCADRRNGTEKGAFRRRRFETITALLIETGIDAETARTELRRMLHD